MTPLATRSRGSIVRIGYQSHDPLILHAGGELARRDPTVSCAGPRFRRAFDCDMDKRFDLVFLEQSQLEFRIRRFGLKPEQRRLFLGGHADVVRGEHVESHAVSPLPREPPVTRTAGAPVDGGETSRPGSRRRAGAFGAASAAKAISPSDGTSEQNGTTGKAISWSKCTLSFHIGLLRFHAFHFRR